MGHNKFQLKIEELDKDAERLRFLHKEQEMKINLFKKTISTLQLQLQEKTSYIVRLENTQSNNQEHIQNDLKQQLISKENECNYLKTEREGFKNDFEYVKNAVETTKKEKDLLINKNNELVQRNQVLEINYQKIVNDLQNRSELFSKIQNQLHMEQNIKQNLESELKNLKLEVSQYRTDLKNISISKDIEIKKLTSKLQDTNISQSVQIVDNDLTQSNIISGVSRARSTPKLSFDKQAIDKFNPRGILPSSQRGIAPSSRRGINPS